MVFNMEQEPRCEQPSGYKVLCTTHGELGSTRYATDAVYLFLGHMQNIRDNHPEQRICEGYDFIPIWEPEVKLFDVMPP